MKVRNDRIWINRALESRLRAAAKTFPVVVLTGARQVGKTSLCRYLWPDANYITFDVPGMAEMARLAPERFLDEHPTPLIMDEIQYVPELLRHIKLRVDEKRQPGSYLITGSQVFPLMQGVSESLAGRCAVLSLKQLTLREVIEAGLLAPEQSDEFHWRGGWPELWSNPATERELWLGSYLATYLERDVRNIVNVTSLRDFERFLRIAALRSGQLLSMADMARDVGVAPNTVKSWLSILQASGQIVLLEPYYVNVGKRLIKAPKLYFTDSGLLLYLLGFRSWQDVTAGSLWGAAWESIVVAEFVKVAANRGRERNLFLWRTAAGDEVDLVIEAGGKCFIAIECKSAEKVSVADMRGIKAMARCYGAEALNAGYCVCRTTAPYPLTSDQKLYALPLADALKIEF